MKNIIIIFLLIFLFILSSNTYERFTVISTPLVTPVVTPQTTPVVKSQVTPQTTPVVKSQVTPQTTPVVTLAEKQVITSTSISNNIQPTIQDNTTIIKYKKPFECDMNDNWNKVTGICTKKGKIIDGKIEYIKPEECTVNDEWNDVIGICTKYGVVLQTTKKDKNKNFSLISLNSDCDTNEYLTGVSMGKKNTITECANECIKHDKCKFFTYGKKGKDKHECMMEHSLDNECNFDKNNIRNTSRFLNGYIKTDNYDLYRLNTNKYMLEHGIKDSILKKQFFNLNESDNINTIINQFDFDNSSKYQKKPWKELLINKKDETVIINIEEMIKLCNELGGDAFYMPKVDVSITKKYIESYRILKFKYENDIISWHRLKYLPSFGVNRDNPKLSGLCYNDDKHFFTDEMKKNIEKYESLDQKNGEGLYIRCSNLDLFDKNIQLLYLNKKRIVSIDK